MAMPGATRSAWNLLRCAHPEPVFAVTAAVAVLALSAGRGWSAGWAVTAVLAGQLFVGWTNDYLDREQDRLSDRTDKPLVTGLVPAGRARVAALVALAACVPLSLANGLAAGGVHLGAVGLASIYNAGLKSTPASVVPYLVCFGLVPAFVTLGMNPGHLPPAWATAGAALLGSGGISRRHSPISRGTAGSASAACPSCSACAGRRSRLRFSSRGRGYLSCSGPDIQESCSWPSSA